MSHPFTKSGSNRPHPESPRRRGPWIAIPAILLVALATSRALADGGVYMFFPEEPYKGLLAHEVKEEVEQDLLYERHNLIDWAAELHPKKPKNVKEAMIKLNVMFRTGMDDYALQAASELKALYPELKPAEVQKNHHYIVKMLFYDYDAPRFSKTAIALIETAPELINTEIYFKLNKLIDRLAQDWGEEKLDRWLAEMMSRSDKPRELIPPLCEADDWFVPIGKKRDPWRLPHQERPGRIFLYLRLKRMRDFDRQTEILRSLEQAARKEPGDILKMLDFILAWQVIYNSDPSPNEHEFDKLEQYSGPDLSWIAEVSQPKTTLEAYYLGMELYESGQWKPAKVFLRKAKALWETTDEKEKIDDGPKKRAIQMADYNSYDKEKFFRPYTLAIDRMIHLCDHQGDASKWRDRKPLTGQLAKNTEEALLQEEKKSADEPTYWHRRAIFYTSEKLDENGKPRELSKAEEALKKGLALTDPRSGPKRQKADRHARVALLKTYATLLHDQKRHEELFRILLDEMEHDPESPFPLELAHSGFFYELHRFLKPEEPIFWKWFEHRPDWEGNKETEYLDWMARTTRDNIPEDWAPVNNEVPETIYRFVERVETMSKKGDVSRMNYCIDLLNGNSNLGIEKNLNRLFPLIRARLKQKDLNKKDRKRLWNRYFYLHMHNNLLEEAEKILDDPNFSARNQDTFRNLALMAAQKGKEKIALKNWRRFMNLNLTNRSQTSLIEIFRQNGLGDDIDTYFNDVKKKLPGFVPLEEK